MSTFKQISLLTLAVTLLYGCFPGPLEVDNVPVPNEQVVVGSYLIPDNFIVVSLSKTITALQAGPESNLNAVIPRLLIPGVEVTVTANSNIYPMTEIVRGIYRIDDIPREAGTKYTLSFVNPFNGQSSHAEAVVLPFVGFSDVKAKLYRTSYDVNLKVSFQIEDPPGDNWYMVNAQQIGNAIDLSQIPFTKVYDQSAVKGNILEDEFLVLFKQFSEKDTVLVSMANISEEYFEFLELRSSQQFQLTEGLGEPINYPTNVHNGLGFFNVHLPDARAFASKNLEQ